MTRLPRIALWLHEHSLAPDDREAVIGDLVEEFAARAAHDPRARPPLGLDADLPFPRHEPASAPRASAIDGGARAPSWSPYAERSEHGSPVRPSSAEAPTADVVCRVPVADGGIGTEHPAPDPRRCRVGASASVARSRPPRRASAAARGGIDAQLLVSRLSRPGRSDARRSTGWSHTAGSARRSPDRKARWRSRAKSSRAISSRRSAYLSAPAAR